MADSDKKVDADGLPAPEALKVQSDDASSSPVAPQVKLVRKIGERRRGSYRPSHKATFIGLAVVVAVLAINGVVIGLVISNQADDGSSANQNAVTLSSETLNTLGVSRTPVGDSNTELAIGPDTTFGGQIEVSGDASIGGRLILNSALAAQDATLTNLQAGAASFETVTVNGDTTATNLIARSGLTVTGASNLQGAVTIGQLLTVNNNVNIVGNLAVGGTLTARTFQANNLISENNLTIGGRIITAGAAPGVVRGGATGNNGTVSISGNDTAGTVAVNAGTGAGNGLLATVTFRNAYPAIPRVVVSPIGGPIGSYYVTRSASGFSIYVANGLAPAGYAFDYIVMQ